MILTYFTEKNNFEFLKLFGINFINSNISNISNNEIILSIIYCLFYLFSSISSKQAFMFTNLFFKSNNHIAINSLFNYLGFVFLLITICIYLEIYFIILIAYLFIYIIYNIRRTVILSILTDLIRKDQRATILSVESLLRSLFIAIFAPMCGIIADMSNLNILFLALGCITLVINHILKKNR